MGIWKRSVLVMVLVAVVSAGFSDLGAQDFSPADLPNLWSWVKGDAGAHVNEDERVYQWDDQSGNGNHYVQADFDRQPHYVASARNGLPGIGEHSIRGQFMAQLGTLYAGGEFYIAVATQMIRGGSRTILGNTAEDHVYFRGDQSIRGKVGGSENIEFTDNNAWEYGQVLLEIWRDSDGALTTFINGEDKTQTPQPTNSNVFALSGIWAQPNYLWDDTSYEFIICDSLPATGERAATREYLRQKWDLYGEQPETPVFVDGFESGDTSAWSEVVN